MVKCKNCQHEQETPFKFCPECAAPNKEADEDSKITKLASKVADELETRKKARKEAKRKEKEDAENAKDKPNGGKSGGIFSF
jgi:hypothetical protein